MLIIDTHQMQRPSLKSTILLAEVESGYVAYDTERDALHRLNPSASLIVELCDGTRTIEGIEAAVEPLLPKAVDSVSSWIQQATKEHLLVEASSSSDREELSGKQLAKLARRLQEYGKIQTAFLCAQRAAQLQPDKPKRLAHLAELALIIGRRDEAREAYESYLQLVPDDAEIQHLLVSLSDEAPPSRVPNTCIEQLYERFSSFYDENMCDDLAYEGPNQLVASIEHAIGDRRGLRIADLGCGTGLAGKKIKSRAAQLVGVDLSPDMVELARELEIYDDLEVAEVTEWLNKSNDHYDLIMACDTLIYFGDLRQVIEPAMARLAPGGVIAFSVESAKQSGFRLTDSGRYEHHLDHITDLASDLGLQCTHREDYMRMEYGEEVTGLFVTMTAA